MTSVLAVGDDELALGDNDDALSEVPRELTWLGNPATRQAGSGLPALPGDRGKKQVT
jgi:hypothetical protein